MNFLETALRTVTKRDLERMTKGQKTKIKLWKNFTIGFEIELGSNRELMNEKIQSPIEHNYTEEYYERTESEFFDNNSFSTHVSDSEARNYIFSEECPADIKYLKFLVHLSKKGIKYKPTGRYSWGDPAAGMGEVGALIHFSRKIISRPKEEALNSDLKVFWDFYHKSPYAKINAFQTVSKGSFKKTILFTENIGQALVNNKIEFSGNMTDALYNSVVTYIRGFLLSFLEESELPADVKNNLKDYFNTRIDEKFDNSRLPLVIQENLSERKKLTPIGGGNRTYVNYLYFEDTGIRTGIFSSLSSFLVAFEFTRGGETAEYSDFLEIAEEENLEEAGLAADIYREFFDMFSDKLENFLQDQLTQKLDEYRENNPPGLEDSNIQAEEYSQLVIDYAEREIGNSEIGEYIQEYKTDESVEFGIEITTRPFGEDESPAEALKMAIDFIRKFKDFMDDHPEFETDSRTGFHINIGTFPKSVFKHGSTTKPPAIRKMDLFKLVVFLGEDFVLDLFNRKGNTYAKSIIEQLGQTGAFQALMTSPVNEQDQKIAKKRVKLQKILYNLYGKYYTANFGKLADFDYIEFRFAGNTGYENPEKSILAIRTLITAIAASMDPELFKKEYIKKLAILSENYGTYNSDEKLRKLISDLRTSSLTNKMVLDHVKSNSRVSIWFAIRLFADEWVSETNYEKNHTDLGFYKELADFVKSAESDPKAAALVRKISIKINSIYRYFYKPRELHKYYTKPDSDFERMAAYYGYDISKLIIQEHMITLYRNLLSPKGVK